MCIRDRILDVRNPKEFKAGHIEGTLLIPLNQLRDNIEEVDRSKKIIVYCRTGYRAYVAVSYTHLDVYKRQE